MPVYFIHGFRWPRPAIRIHIILHNLEDSAAEWLVAPGTTREMLENFNTLYPECMEHLKHLRFVEQYDPNDTTAGSGSQPYAYVADVVEEIKLGVDIDDIRGKGVPNDQWASLMELRDKLAPEEKVAWYIVVCGDEERWAPTTAELAHQEEVMTPTPYQEPERESRQLDSFNVGRSTVQASARRSLTDLQSQQNQSPQGEQPKGIKKLFSSVARRKSRSRAGDSPVSPQAASKTSQPTSPSARQSQPPNGTAQPVSNGIKVQTTNLTPANSAPNSGNHSAPSAGSANSWEANDEHEVITGPTIEDDSLAAPSPTVRHGREADVAIRNKRFSKFSVYPNPYNSTIRTVSPDAARSLSPQGRTGNNLDSIVTNNSADSSRRQSLNFSRNSSPHTRTPTGAVTPATYKPSTGSNSGASTPATFHTAHDRNSHITPRSSYSPSANTSRQSLAQPPPSANISRSSLILPNHQQQQKQHSLPYPQRASVVTNNSRNSVLSQSTRQPSSLPPNAMSASSKDVSHRASQQTMSGMSPTVQALYGQHERDWKKRQSVKPDDLIAKGLDEGVFAGLK